MSPPAGIRFLGTEFQNPILLAAGTAGFGREIAGVVDLDRLGGIVTKSLSLEPRVGHPSPRVAEFSGGMLNAVGLANPGVEAALHDELRWLFAHLRRARILVSVVGSTVEDYVSVVERLADAQAVVALELNLSCPNTARGGEHFGADDGVLGDLIRRCRSVARHPVIAKLAPTLGDIGRTARVAADAGAQAITVVNTIPGALYRWSRASGAAAGRLGAASGGVSGPALLPIGVLATRRVREATDLPVIGVGGVRTPEDVRQYREAGATLVAVGTAALADPRRPQGLAEAWARG